MLCELFSVQVYLWKSGSSKLVNAHEIAYTSLATLIMIYNRVAYIMKKPSTYR